MSDPSPRTCRSIEPRFTVSVQMVARSTLGAAGLSRATPTVSSYQYDESDATPDKLAAALLMFEFRPGDIHCNLERAST